ncbi:hypothetical protein EV175_003477 [Coemansia sp. RSA 1933]|nr:hypothetical protein EV175_003477 [Coemansia sp. RSA 1933]
MSRGAYVEDLEELAKFTATTSTAQFPAAISPIAPLYRLEEGSTSTAAENQVLLTVQGEGIQIYSVLDNKCLRSWTFSPSTRFACPAKYSTSGNSGSKGSGSDEAYVYVALDSGDGVDNQHKSAVVWRWADRGIDSVGLEDKIEAKYPSPIFSLEPGATRAGHLLAVHTNGAVTLSDQDLNKTFGMNATTPGQVRLVWYQLVDVSQSMRSYLDSRQVTDWLDGDFRLALTLNRVKDVDDSDKDAYSYYFSLLAIDGSEATVSEVGTTRVNPIQLSTSPLSCAFDTDSGTVALLTCTGVYQNLALKMGSSALDDPIILEQAKEVTLRGFVPCVSDADENDDSLAPNQLTQSQLTMVSLSEKYVAIAGTHSVVSHASKGPYESVLTVWDLQYGCLHAEKPIGVSSAHLSAGSKQKQKQNKLPRMVYQLQPLNPRLNELGASNDQIALGIMAAHTSMPHSCFDGDATEKAGVASKTEGKRQTATDSTAVWNVEMFYASAFLPPVTLLASLRLQNNAKYYIDPVVQSARAKSVVHSSNILLHEEQEQGLGVLRSGWEAIADGTIGDNSTSASAAGNISTDTVEMFLTIGHRRENTQKEENEVLLALSNVSDSVDSNQYTALFMDHIGVATRPDSPAATDSPTWISAYLMTTVMRRCFVEPLGVSRSSRLPLFAPRVIEFMLLNCGLCNSHAPAPGLLPHLLARVDKSCPALSDDQAWNLIDIALRHCPDLPEKQVVDVLQFQLSHYATFTDRLFDVEPSQPMQEEDENTAGELASSATADIKRTLSAIVATAGSDKMLRLALSGLPLGHAVCLIRLLVIWLREWSQLGANVEIAASAACVSSANSPMPSEIYDSETHNDDHGETSSATISRIVALASDKTTQDQQQHEGGVPSVDASLTVFKEPRKLSDDEEPNAVIVRVFTNKWAPALELPDQLVGAPEVGAIVDFVSLLLDAHMTKIMLSAEFSGLISRLKSATDEALAISDQLRLLRVGLLPFNSAWEKQHDERVAKDVAKQKEMLGLDEVVLRNGTTRSQAENQRQIQPNARCAQGTGSTGTYWEQVQKLEKYRVEVMHW